MIIKLAASCVVSAALLLPVAGFAADTDRSPTTTYVKDSVITTKIKAELAADRLSSLLHVSVDTDDKGKVVLTGTAANQNAVDKAVAIAKSVQGVTDVDNRIRIVADKY